MAGGVVVIALITFIQDTVIEHRVKRAQQAVMASIDREEQAIRHAREEAEQRDQKVDEAFDRAMQSSKDVIDSSKNTMSEVRRTMDIEMFDHIKGILHLHRYGILNLLARILAV